MQISIAGVELSGSHSVGRPEAGVRSSEFEARVCRCQMLDGRINGRTKGAPAGV